MKILVLIQTAFICSILSCSSNANRAKPNQLDKYSSPPYTSDTTKVTKEYIATGFYLLVENLDGIKMRKERSNEVYNISKKPFVSVDNISHCRLQLDSLADGVAGIINMEFDEEGTKNFKDVTGNPLYKYIAVVIANKLLYVVEVQGKITTGKTSILLNDYSKEEMQAMVDEINKKR